MNKAVVKVIGKPWAKGQSGNPKGREPLPKEIRDLREERKEEVIKVIDKWLFNSTKEELMKATERDDIRAIDLCVIRIIMGGIAKGDPMRINALLDRIIGPVSQKIKAEITNPLMKHIGSVPPHLLGDKIEKMLEKRKTILAEFTEIKKEET
jgi:hypothetical protein